MDSQIGLIKDVFSKIKSEDEDKLNIETIKHILHMCSTYVNSICHNESSQAMEMIQNGLKILLDMSLITYYDIEDIIVSCMIYIVINNSDTNIQDNVNRFMDKLSKSKITSSMFSPDRLLIIINNISNNKKQKQVTKLPSMPLRYITIHDIITESIKK